MGIRGKEKGKLGKGEENKTFLSPLFYNSSRPKKTDTRARESIDNNYNSATMFLRVVICANGRVYLASLFYIFVLFVPDSEILNDQNTIHPDKVERGVRRVF